MSRAVLTLVLLAVLSACAGFPEVDEAQAARNAVGATPVLVPLDGLLAQATPGRATAAARDGLAARAAGLRARAAAMHGPVHSPDTRARLAAALAAHPMTVN
jgi:hypothetical protein